MGWKLGKLFFHCLNVIYPENGGKDGRLLKLLVELELDKPLIRGTRLKLENEVIWVDLKYEILPTFCFYCGIIGHSEKACETKMDDSRKDQVREGQYGIWLRASQVKRGKRGESVIATARNELGQNMITHLRVATSEKLVGDELKRNETT